MSRSLFALIAGSLTMMSAAAGYVQAAGSQRQPSGGPDQSASPQRALLDRYCVTCHNERLVRGESSSPAPSPLVSQLRAVGLTLDTMDVSNVKQNAEVWEKVVRKLRAGAMPPPPMPRPDKATYDGFRRWLETELDRAAAANPSPGRTEAFHRLSRTEYHNVIRDLLALEIDVAELLPADDTSYGFDNIAGVLGVSPTLMERYLSAARKISRLAVGAPGASPTAETFRVESDLGQDDHLVGLPFGTRGGMVVRYNFPEDAEYLIEVEPDGPLRIEPHQLEVTLDGDRVELFTVGRTPAPEERRGAYQAAAKALQVRVPVKAGPREIGVAFLKRTSAEPEGVRQLYLRPFTGEGSGRDSRYQPYLDSVTITGPFEASGARPTEETPSRRRIFVCRPASPAPADEASCARQILWTLARRAYRRPVTDADLQGLLTFYNDGRAKGGFEAGVELALRRLLVSPEFLFRVERDRPNIAPETAYRLGDLELASRLSFFLWSSIPDEELLDVAIRGKLRDPAVLEQQTGRMLADERSQALVTNFAGQWLGLRNVSAVQPDEDVFPDFGESLRQAFQRETELFVDSILREDRSVLDLLAADYTFVNERLASHYGIPNVRGSRFRRVTLDDNVRGGLLGQGSILTVTSYANRTSPVLRGKWILENILGTPPPPPLPNVPELSATNAEGKVLSMRDRMVQHRVNPVCASCHRLMDPLGFALEPFDAVGRWRTRSESKTPIDASGVLPDGTQFEGPAGLRQALLSAPERFVTTVTEKLLTYALGRGLEYYDAPAVRAITQDAARTDYRLSSLIMGIVRSTPFQMRRSQS